MKKYIGKILILIFTRLWLPTQIEAQDQKDAKLAHELSYPIALIPFGDAVCTCRLNG